MGALPVARALVHRVALHSRSDALQHRHLLSADERARAGRFERTSDHDAYVITRTTLRRVLAHHLNTRADAIEIVHGPHDKPLLRAGEGNELYFNVSHSDGLALIAVADLPVGIDLEPRRAVADLTALAAQNFSAEEIGMLRAASTHERNELFLRCWTRKEAFTKATGDGISSHLDRFAVSLDLEEPALLHLRHRASERPGDYSFAHLDPAPGYVGALVAVAPGLRWRYALADDEALP